MKIVAMIGSESTPLIYFANAIHAHSDLSLLIVEQAVEKQNMVGTARSHASLYARLIGYIKFRLELWESRRNAVFFDKKQKEDIQNLYGDLGQRISPNIEVLYTNSVNSNEVLAALKELKPDLILDHGTTLVKKDTINMAPLTLNLHWGLSPYYRGVDSTLHALLNCDPLNIGVTIHKLSEKIDGGDIFAQERIKISENDNAHSIPLRLTLAGTALMIRAIDILKSGNALRFVEQKSKEGFLFRNSHWNHHTHQYGKFIQPKDMQAMLKHPSRRELPIIEINQ